MTGNRAASQLTNTLEHIQQLIQKLRFPYSDRLLDWQSDLAIRKSVEKEDISTRSLEDVSLRAFAGDHWLYANTSDTSRGDQENTPQTQGEEKERLEDRRRAWVEIRESNKPKIPLRPMSIHIERIYFHPTNNPNRKGPVV